MQTAFFGPPPDNLYAVAALVRAWITFKQNRMNLKTAIQPLMDTNEH